MYVCMYVCVKLFDIHPYIRLKIKLTHRKESQYESPFSNIRPTNSELLASAYLFVNFRSS